MTMKGMCCGANAAWWVDWGRRLCSCHDKHIQSAEVGKLPRFIPLTVPVIPLCVSLCLLCMTEETDALHPHCSSLLRPSV